MVGELKIRETAIRGLLILDLPVHGDERGWFKENWQREKMTRLGLPDFSPVQHNVALNGSVGVTRGLHAEPWDKLVSVARGRVFGAWVDLRAGTTFGTVVTLSLGPETAVFVPRGIANAYQVVEEETVYSYLVNDHWSPEKRDEYGYVNLADESLAIPWPIPLEKATMSDADTAHPALADVDPLPERGTIVIGAGGQLGRAVMKLLPGAVGLNRPEFSLGAPESFDAIDWSRIGTIINAGAYTAVDEAETLEGRRAAWTVNVSGVAQLCRIAQQHRITLVHVSSDYVFDGCTQEHDEDEVPSPLGVYGQTKAAGDALISQVDRHYVARTSWLIGEGRNFVSTMEDLARRGVSPSVVDDQHGRLTFTDDLAAAIVHLLNSRAPYGTYNVTGSGPVQSWADIARDVFQVCGRAREDVRPVSTEEYSTRSTDRPTAPRPRHSTLTLDKISRAGFRPPDVAERLGSYVNALLLRSTMEQDK